MEKLSTTFWFTIGSGLVAGWLGVVFAISEGSLVSQEEALNVLVSDEPPADFTKARDFVLMDHRT